MPTGVYPHKSTPPEIRFWSNVSKSEDCWEWTRSQHEFGYGRFNNGEKIVKAHRFSYELANGPIPEGLFVCHKCDNPKCVRPEHLFIGSCQDNIDDMVKKGRYVHGKVYRGEENKQAKLNTADISEIRRLYAAKIYNQRELGERYGVSQLHVSRIVRRVVWRQAA